MSAFAEWDAATQLKYALRVCGSRKYAQLSPDEMMATAVASALLELLETQRNPLRVADPEPTPQRLDLVKQAREFYDAGGDGMWSMLAGFGEEVIRSYCAAVDDPKRAHLHYEGCPFKPFSEMPEVPDDAPRCTCAESHKGAYWKGQHMLERGYHRVNLGVILKVLEDDREWDARPRIGRQDLLKVVRAMKEKVG